MRAVRRWLWIVSLAVSALLTQHANGAASAASPNIILITLDTTRADRMGFLGSKRGLTPNLDGLAKDSAVFTRAYSQAPLTPTSHATILTGTYPQYHQVLMFQTPLGKDIPYLPEVLKGHGYSTAAFVGALALDPAFSVPGFDRGFDTYDAGFDQEAYTPKTRYQTTERRAGEVVSRALAWLSKHEQGPFFLWVHLYDPHEPYDPPEPYKTRYAKAPYDGEVAYADSALGKLFRQLKASGLYDGTMIAVTADHGESLGAHGEETHGIFIYDETIHVPLLIKLPMGGSAGKPRDGQRIENQRIDDRVELADIMPTLLQALGIAVPEKVQGQSLLGFITPGTPEGEAAAKAWRDRGAYSQGDYGHIVFAWSTLQSLRAGKYLYIQAPHRELYDDGQDAKEEHNLASASPAVADTLSAQLEAFRQKTSGTPPAAQATVNSAEAEKLAALGYMSARSESSVAASAENGADPKDKIETANIVRRIDTLLQDRHCDAMPAIRKAILATPNIAMLHFFLGRCYAEQGDLEKAVPELRKSVQLDAGLTRGEMSLGQVLLKLEDYDGAAEAFEHMVKMDPSHIDARVFLVVTYAKADRVQDEIRACRAVLALEPEQYGSNLNLGYFLGKSGDLEGAIPSLLKAASIRPTKPIAHIYLAEVYEKLGRKADAERERQEAQRLGAVLRDQPHTPPGPGMENAPKQ